MGEEFENLRTRLADAKSLVTHVHCQYLESALSYAVSFLQTPDQGQAAGKSADRLQKVVADQNASLAAQENGLQEGLVQPVLLACARTFLS